MKHDLARWAAIEDAHAREAMRTLSCQRTEPPRLGPKLYPQPGSRVPPNPRWYQPLLPCDPGSNRRSMPVYPGSEDLSDCPMWPATPAWPTTRGAADAPRWLTSRWLAPAAAANAPDAAPITRMTVNDEPNLRNKPWRRMTILLIEYRGARTSTQVSSSAGHCESVIAMPFWRRRNPVAHGIALPA